MSILGGPIPNALGAGAQNGVDFFPHGLVAFRLGVEFVLKACVKLDGEIQAIVTLTGEVTSVQQLNAQVHTAVTMAAEVQAMFNLSGEITTIVTLAGEIGVCD